MNTSLTILSSLAIIVTAVIAFAEYQAGKRRHSTTLSIEMLHKQKDDFIKWFYGLSSYLTSVDASNNST